MKIYGSKLCPDCQKLLSVLGETDMVFEFLDITENLMNLKMFLKFRLQLLTSLVITMLKLIHYLDHRLLVLICLLT